MFKERNEKKLMLERKTFALAYALPVFSDYTKLALRLLLSQTTSQFSNG